MKNEPFTPPPNPTLSALWSTDRTELLLLPPIIYVIGLFQRDPVSVHIAFVGWAIGYVLWALWTMWRVTDRWPRAPEQNWRGVAILVYGGAPWFLFIPFWSALTTRTGEVAVFPFIYGVGAWALVWARIPREAPPRARARLLAGASLICWLWMLTYLCATLVFGVMPFWRPPEDGGATSAFALTLCVPLGLLAGFLAFKLGRRAAAAWREK